MRVLIYTSSGGTAHDAAAEAIADWLKLMAPEVTVTVESVLEKASSAYRSGVDLYNWIQRRAPWLHQLYWRLMEFEDLIKPGTVLFGHGYLVRSLKRLQPDLLISTHPHTNRGHFDLAKRVVGPQLRCITCCTELDGGFGFSRNWVSPKADLFWAITEEVAREVRRRRFPPERIAVLGPLLHPPFHQKESSPPPRSELAEALPLLVLGTGANGANNHLAQLEALLPFAGRLRVVALCGKRPEVRALVVAWGRAHPGLSLSARGFQGPQAMVDLYREAWAMVARPGARTATEALTLGCPLILNHHGLTMPQELLAMRYFRARHLEVSVRQPAQLAQVVGRWLDDPAVYEDGKERWAAFRLTADPVAVISSLLAV
jgi:UDP-N-acetylglucosamine:LPS N-acetylglucosamine transferase